ncbi:hypothetical protein FRC17_006739 [Serendipita sp. 399]|nr:hypothetical protein FRC17_006739 [Serendipita sp. 399]
MRLGALPWSIWGLLPFYIPSIIASRGEDTRIDPTFNRSEAEWSKPPPPPEPLPLPPPRPLVIWHGLGDQYASPGMMDFIELIKQTHPGIFVHSVRISDEPSSDQRAGWFGNVNDQIAQVAEQIASIPELQSGFDAMGFSQAGQFLRAYVERYNSPPVRNLITFGSQHMGISDLPGCRPTDFLCRAARSAAGAGVYTYYAQHHLVQAQYFRDHNHYTSYLRSSTFLADINNEIAEDDGDDDLTNESGMQSSRNATYAANLATLDNFVMILFDKDQTVVPKESAWFGSYELPDDEDDSPTTDAPPIVLMRQQPLYKEDWIGLRTLDEQGKVHQVVCNGEHMRLEEACWLPIVERWTGDIEMDDPDTKDSQKSPAISPLLLQDW